MSMTTEQLIKEMDEFIELNKDARRIGNELMNNIKGRFEHLERKADKSYEKGLEDAWELCRKIFSDDDDALLPLELREIFTCWDAANYFINILHNHTAKEALEMVSEYEKKKAEEEAKRIRIGDVVRLKDPIGYGPGVVAGLSDDGKCVSVIFSDFSWQKNALWFVDQIEKTGQHVDLEKLFEGIEED